MSRCWDCGKLNAVTTAGRCRQCFSGRPANDDDPNGKNYDPKKPRLTVRQATRRKTR